MRLIDADITIKSIEEVRKIMNEEIIENNRKDLINFVNGLNQACLCISQQPTLERPKGKWKRGFWHIICSECGADFSHNITNYCPNCGAEMEMEE